MCFSASASFAAAAALGGEGVLSIRAAPTRRHLAFAAIPFLFAAQQACEGALWLILDRAPFNKATSPLGYLFLSFAFAIWPTYLPLALAVIESSRSRRTVLRLCAAAGALMGLYLLGCASLRRSDECIAFGNLYYWVQLDVPVKRIAPFVYLSIVSIPPFISSLRGTSVLAVVLVASFSLCGILYRAGFLSVWCFSAAVLSGIVAAIVLIDRPRPSS